MTAISACAYALLVALTVVCCRRGASARAGAKPSRPGPRETAACLCILAGFYFVPPGSLPPFCNVSWGGGAFLLLLALSTALIRKREAFASIALMFFTAASFALYAHMRGFPGSFANFGTFVAMPFWSAATPVALAGFVLLAAGCVVALARLAPRSGGQFAWAEAAQCLAGGAFAVTLFLPLNCAPLVRWPESAAAGCDFLLFWAKTLLLCVLVQRFRLSRQAERLAWACCAAGAAAVIFSLHSL